MSAPVPAPQNRRVLRRALWLTAGSFLFCFSLVPAYRIACEKVFGIKLANAAAGEQQVDALGVDRSRLVTVQFDAGVNSALAWQFAPKVGSVRVHPGELTEAWYTASNVSGQALVGQAVPSVAPSTASTYFNKTECFCFTEQLLGANETREMPLKFVVDPKLPADVDTITLSYTFFLNDIATRRAADAGKPPVPAG